MGALYSGKAVPIHPNDPVFTTQQAAELLGVSRLTVVKLIEDGELEAIKVTRHKRIRLEDVIRYRDRRMAGQVRFLASTTHFDDAPVLDEFVEVQKELAQERRQKA